jgi:hypothetical protein
MLSVGEWVEVLPAREIASTLDAEGALDHLPFMPEMLPHCGRRFRVRVRAERTCARGLPPGERPIRRLDGAIVLEGLRCDGSAHGGCQLGCMLYWKEAWVRRVGAPARGAASAEVPRPALRVHRRDDPTAYYCQGTELARATTSSPPLWSPGQYLRMLRVGTLTPSRLVAQYAHSVAGRLSRALRSQPAAPPRRGGDGEILGLGPGEWVRVKTKAEILETLDAKGAHRGLGFADDYDVYCGRTFRVKERVERIVDETTGKLRRIRDTVALEGACCRRHHGCAREMPALWREAWLTRVDRAGGPP